MPLITPANARELAARSAQVRRERKASAELASAQAALLAAAPAAQAGDPYVLARLVRVREQLNRIDGMMAAERDPQRLDRLASAQARVSEQERTLAGRPLPGSHKPERVKANRRGPRQEGPIGLDPAT